MAAGGRKALDISLKKKRNEKKNETCHWQTLFNGKTGYVLLSCRRVVLVVAAEEQVEWGFGFVQR